jgi:hypothetical protein
MGKTMVKISSNGHPRAWGNSSVYRRRAELIEGLAAHLKDVCQPPSAASW